MSNIEPVPTSIMSNIILVHTQTVFRIVLLHRKNRTIYTATFLIPISSQIKQQKPKILVLINKCRKQQEQNRASTAIAAIARGNAWSMTNWIIDSIEVIMD